jgi:UDP-glucose 4-epimerase
MKYLITGGCGFIGSHLVRELLRQNNEVVVLDDLSTGFLEYLPEDEKVSVIQVDLSNWNDLSRNFSCFKGIHGVFHLAAQARIQTSIENPFSTHNSNVNGIINLLEIMRMMGVYKIVYSASSSSYGESEIPCREGTLMDCLNPYSLSKYVGELYCQTWGKLHGIKNISLRYFNVYGQRSPLEGPYATVIGLFFRQALKDNTPLTIVGDGEQKRDFTNVKDIVKANVLAMQKIHDIDGETINIGTGENYSINQVARFVKDSLFSYGVAATQVSIPPRLGETRESLADVTKAKELLGWEASVPLNTGIKNLSSWFLNNLDRLKDGRILV